MTTIEIMLTIIGSLLIVLQTLAFGYWVHVDSKLTAKLDASNARSDQIMAVLMANSGLSYPAKKEGK